MDYGTKAMPPPSDTYGVMDGLPRRPRTRSARRAGGQDAPRHVPGRVVHDTSAWHLLAFFLLAFGWSWALWGPEALVAQGRLESWPALPAVAAFGPTLAGLAMVYVDRGWAGLADLGRRTLSIGSLQWLLVGILVFPVVTGAALLLAMRQGFSPSFPWAGNLVVLPAAFVTILLLGGPVEEEFGWRGYALDPLQARFGALGGSVVLGLAWSLWHLPLFYLPTETAYYDRPFWGLVVSVTLLSVLLTWLYNNTRGSLLVVLLAHTAFNWSHGMLPVIENEFYSLFYLALLALVVVVVVAVWGPRTLVRGADDLGEEPGVGAEG